MSTSISLITLFGIIPILLGYLANVRSSPRKRALYRLQTKRIKKWSAIEYSTTVFIACTAAFYIAGLMALAGIKFEQMTYFYLLIVTCTSALIFLCCRWKIPEFLAKHWEKVKIFVAPAAIAIATLSKIYSDAGIAELTGLSPQNLPGAQLLLTLIMTPAIWLLGLSLFIGYASIPLMVILLAITLIRDFSNKNEPQNKKPAPNLLHFMTIAAVALFAIMLLTITQKIAGKNFYEPRLRKSIAFASFQLPTTYCELPETKGAGIAAMDDDRAAIAIPDKELGYRFELISCKPKQQEKEQISSTLRDFAKNQKHASSAPSATSEALSN
ncbi:hypothetical protein [Pseudomonas glycinae]|uniref:hypothetical protein n=1 Tax=Pseudomonas glycinae TaxID=1785145 RepID=UPI001F42E0B6|nr:hypothetical protein [Pseudomonas glycinae]